MKTTTDTKKQKIEILHSSANPIYEERESGITHSPFELEYTLYQIIKAGDTERLPSYIDQYLEHGLYIGPLSHNPVHQTAYWAISCISIAIHYAILGGLDETDAYNLSDHYIQQIDHFTSMEQIIPYLKEKALELTQLVKDSKTKANLSPQIQICLHYIHIHLHEKLTIASLSQYCGLSRDYLSSLFKKEMQISLHTYILGQKLEASKIQLIEGRSYNEISYTFGFCSESHYITCFNRFYGMTPGEFRAQSIPVIHQKSYLSDL